MQVWTAYLAFDFPAGILHFSSPNKSVKYSQRIPPKLVVSFNLATNPQISCFWLWILMVSISERKT